LTRSSHIRLRSISKKAGETEKAQQFYHLAGQLPTDYCFPFQLESVQIFERALEVNAGDARAALYLGNLLYDRQPEAATRAWEKAMRQGIFTVAFSLYLDESTEFADIVLPDTCYLERLDARADWQSSLSPVDEWSWHLRQDSLISNNKILCLRQALNITWYRASNF
jgi:anaerobic selenocysteine-containing dehydrogenase